MELKTIDSEKLNPRPKVVIKMVRQKNDSLFSYFTGKRLGNIGKISSVNLPLTYNCNGFHYLLPNKESFEYYGVLSWKRLQDLDAYYVLCVALNCVENKNQGIAQTLIPYKICNYHDFKYDRKGSITIKSVKNLLAYERSLKWRVL